MSQGEDTPSRRLANLIRGARHRARLSQEELADEAGVGRATISRWEKGSETRFPQPDSIRKVVTVLGVDPREVVIALGYVTRDEMGLPPEPPRVIDPVLADVVDMLADPTVPARQKTDWADYLRWQYQRLHPDRAAKGVPRGTQKATPPSSPSR